MSIKDKFKTDASAARDGVWFDYPANSDGTIPAFRLARASGKQNKKYALACRKLVGDVDSVTGLPDLSSIKDEDAEKLLLDIFVDTILIEWRNFQPEDDGVVLEFSRDNAIALLGSPDWVDLYLDLDEKAKRASSFRARSLEAQAKNS